MSDTDFSDGHGEDVSDKRRIKAGDYIPIPITNQTNILLAEAAIYDNGATETVINQPESDQEECKNGLPKYAYFDFTVPATDNMTIQQGLSAQAIKKVNKNGNLVFMNATIQINTRSQDGQHFQVQVIITPRENHIPEIAIIYLEIVINSVAYGGIAAAALTDISTWP